MESQSYSEAPISPPACQWTGAFLSRWVFLSGSWLLLNFAPSLLAFFPESKISLFLIRHFSGSLYRPWALWFIDYYWLAFSLAGPLYFYAQRGRFSLDNDKYQALLGFILQGAFCRWGLVNVSWSPLVRLGLLSVLLKLFFLPYMVTWCIENSQHLWVIFNSSNWGFHAVTVFLIQLCLLMDIAIFSFGYLVESRRLGSDIRSVDPNWLGWLFCLWCYPPFNAVSFQPFDFALFPIQIDTNQTTRLFFNAVEVALWIVFAWASLSLGFKASNLTARGTVRIGPYRWLRHPAYTAKLGVWWIQGVIFGEFTVGILLAYTLVYVLRALTEERHLRAVDADYAQYCSIVRSRFLPVPESSRSFLKNHRDYFVNFLYLIRCGLSASLPRRR